MIEVDVVNVALSSEQQMEMGYQTKLKLMAPHRFFQPLFLSLAPTGARTATPLGEIKQAVSLGKRGDAARR